MPRLQFLSAKSQRKQMLSNWNRAFLGFLRVQSGLEDRYVPFFRHGSAGRYGD